MKTQHANLIAAMADYDAGDAKRIQHFIKVHSFAAAIATLEKVDEETQFILETAAIVHDIGIHVCEQKYGSCNGKLQEKEGPEEARKLLMSLHVYTAEQIERVCWLVGHHHTYKDISGIDYQILIEADFLVNILEANLSATTIQQIKNNILRTSSGLHFLKALYG